MSDVDACAEARRVLTAEAEAIAATAERLGKGFTRAVRMLAAAPMVHVSGIGKSGHIARKIAATMCSTGTRANFLHPVEALHGDIGVVSGGDVAILISRSGECNEVIYLADALKAHPIIAITGEPASRLAQRAHATIDVGCDEACPLGLAPTSSTAASLAVGDALALVLMQLSARTAEDFRATHPGGALGR